MTILLVLNVLNNSIFPLSIRRQRKARHMTDELHSGGSLELVQSVSRQLAIVTNHLNDNSQVGTLTNSM